jgi:hypothetical protein
MDGAPSEVGRSSSTFVCWSNPVQRLAGRGSGAERREGVFHDGDSSSMTPARTKGKAPTPVDLTA